MIDGSSDPVGNPIRCDASEDGAALDSNAIDEGRIPSGRTSEGDVTGDD